MLRTEEIGGLSGTEVGGGASVSACGSGHPLSGPARLTGTHPLPLLPDLEPFEGRVWGTASGTRRLLPPGVPGNSTHFSPHSSGAWPPLRSAQQPRVSSSSQGRAPSQVHPGPGLHGDSGPHPEMRSRGTGPTPTVAPPRAPGGSARDTEGLCPCEPHSFGKPRDPERSRQAVADCGRAQWGPCSEAFKISPRGVLSPRPRPQPGVPAAPRTAHAAFGTSGERVRRGTHSSALQSH